jgi:hypothetical protein
MFDERTQQQAQAIVDVENSILKCYDDVIGELGIKPFRDRVVALARQELGAMPSLYYTVMKGMIDSAGYLSEGNLIRFWQEHVTADSFRFHTHGLPQAQLIDQVQVHINSSDILDNLKLGKLVPPHILKNKRFKQENFETAPDQYRVCFAQGRSDLLAKFLVGHRLLCSVDDDECTLLKAEGLEFFLHSRLGLAPANNSDIHYSGPHECVSLLTSGGTSLPWRVPMFHSVKSVEVAVNRITPVVLTPDQRAQLFQEGLSFYQQHKDAPWWEPVFDLANREQAARVFVQVRHLELAVEYSLCVMERERQQTTLPDLGELK